MASVLYPTAKDSFGGRDTYPSIDLDTDTVKVALVNTSADYTYSAAHQYMSSVTAYSGTTDQTLGGASLVGGVFDTTDNPTTWTAVAIDGVKDVEALVIYKDTGVAATSPLIAYVDGFSAVTPDGNDIEAYWDDGANKVFAL